VLVSNPEAGCGASVATVSATSVRAVITGDWPASEPTSPLKFVFKESGV